MARRSTEDTEPGDMNLAPIMNMVMILIPMLLLMVQFSHYGVSPVQTTSSGGGAASSKSDKDEVKPPRVLISISDDGFRLADFYGSPDFATYSEPISRCAGVAGTGGEDAAPPTVCLQSGSTPTKGDYSGLDYAGLYDRLVQIRMHEPWKKAYGKAENAVVLLTAESDVPAAVVVRTMDLARYFLDPDGGGSGELANPLESNVSDLSPYLLGGSAGEATQEDLLKAGFYITDDSPGLNRDKSGNPSNILPMFPSVSLVAPR